MSNCIIQSNITIIHCTSMARDQRTSKALLPAQPQADPLPGVPARCSSPLCVSRGHVSVPACVLVCPTLLRSHLPLILLSTEYLTPFLYDPLFVQTLPYSTVNVTAVEQSQSKQRHIFKLQSSNNSHSLKTIL